MPDLEQELFDSAMSDDPPAQAETPAQQDQPQQETVERPRDELGRFAPKGESDEQKPETQAKEPAKAQEQQEQQPAVQSAPAQEQRQDHRVPLPELMAEREKRQAAERRFEETNQMLQNLQHQMRQLQSAVQQPQQQAPKPNLFENPEQWEQTQQQQVQSLLQQQTLTFSEQLARIKFGDELYEAADKAAQQALMSGQIDPALAAIGRAPNPGIALVEWFKRKQNLDRLGGLDLDNYLEQEMEKRLASDPALQAKWLEKWRAQAQGQSGPATQKPKATTLPSLNRQTSAASDATDAEDESDAGLLKAALKR